MKWKVYHYANCDTCRRALKFLAARDVEFTPVPIREQPPVLRTIRTGRAQPLEIERRDAGRRRHFRLTFRQVELQLHMNALLDSFETDFEFDKWIHANWETPISPPPDRIGR